MIWMRRTVRRYGSKGGVKKEKKEINLASDRPVGEDTVEKNVESLAAVEDGVDPLDRERGARQGKEPGESKQE